jgi:hypothetical protein
LGKSRLPLSQEDHINITGFIREYFTTPLTKIYLIPPKVSCVDHCYFWPFIMNHIELGLSSRNVRTNLWIRYSMIELITRVSACRERLKTYISVILRPTKDVALSQ